ncbi:YqaJ viral recombinase family protein (plasmid) [Leptotrichia wadei]|uniref:YqaJ viral recombinase family protein n=1 Tax=Leptotrichia wadei TaxID=157687 RepID=A0A510L1C1_9FUSO|nr:YqaJ viral recombinase family protein [Leptotrichia wadei]BBM55935.1 YqaJ viral recombinase family protein [Leptotrichia wadei]
MGKNKYRNIIDVWKDKTGRIQNNFASPAAQRGKNLKNIFNSYKEDNLDKKILEVNKMYIHPKYDFIRANLDGEIVYQDKKGYLK